MSNDTVTRIFGGSPLAVLGRLILVSILVGVILSALNFDPWNLVNTVRDLVVAIWKMGFKSIELIWRYFLLGAILVIPIWLVIRLVQAPKGR